ncbi:hypothetical protein NW766_006452 [Fusarium irregulare]|uniref:Methyltransferase n=1 Tax=Fusarium irregulare TaxID=2494466 RepID=A0A9W8PRD7_9HYPO|nr:hypothetical protein NW766_006452 [Fusarium irregulare]
MAEHPTEAESSPRQPAASSPVPEQTAEQTPAEGSGEDFHGAEHWATLTGGNAPEDEDDADSAVGEDTASSTESMSSSILHYRTMNGRTYHAERGNAHYWTPNDEHHSESMDMAHHLLSLSLEGKLHLAPLKDDIQTSIPTLKSPEPISPQFSQAGFLRISNCNSKPKPLSSPSNKPSEIEDCTQEWTFEPESFDYVHMRYMYGSISDWNALFREAYKACKPGGWCESFEASPRMESDDGTVTEDCAINEWGKFFIEGGRKLNRTFEIIDKDLQQKGMEEAGFVDIKTWDHKAPIGDWPKDSRLKEIGQFARATLEQDYEGYVMYMANIVLGWSREEVSLYCAQLRKEVRSGKFHPYYRQRVVYGRKPE